MGQRIEFRFGKNSSFECDISQIILTEGENLASALARQWIIVRSSTGGTRVINASRCTQILLGLPDQMQNLQQESDK
jgi:hypothetical protein